MQLCAYTDGPQSEYSFLKRYVYVASNIKTVFQENERLSFYYIEHLWLQRYQEPIETNL